MDKNEIVWMDDEMPLNKKRRAYSAHKRKPYNLRLKSLKKWRQRGGFEWSGYKELLKTTKESDEVLQKLEADYASNQDALDKDDEFKQWLLAFQSGDATGNKKRDLLKLIEGKEKANKQALAEESKKLSPEGKAAAAKAEAQAAAAAEKEANKEAAMEKAAFEKQNVKEDKAYDTEFNPENARKMTGEDAPVAPPTVLEKGKLRLKIVTKYTKPDMDTRLNAPKEYIETALEISKPETLEELKTALANTDQGNLSIDEYIDNNAVFFNPNSDKLLLDENTPLNDGNVKTLPDDGKIIIRAEGIKLTLIGKTGEEVEAVDFMLSIKIEEVVAKWQSQLEGNQTGNPLLKYLLFYEQGKNDTVWVDYEGKDKGKNLKQIGITADTTFRIRSKLYVFFERVLYKDLYYLIDVQYIRNIFDYLSTSTESAEYVDLIQVKPFPIKNNDTTVTQQKWEELEGGTETQHTVQSGGVIWRKEAERADDVKYVGFPVPEYTPPIDPVTSTEKYCMALLATNTKNEKDDNLFNDFFFAKGSTKGEKEAGINELIAKVDTSILSKIQSFLYRFVISVDDDESNKNKGQSVIPDSGIESIINNYLDTKKPGFVNIWGDSLKLKPLEKTLDFIEENKDSEKSDVQFAILEKETEVFNIVAPMIVDDKSSSWKFYKMNDHTKEIRVNRLYFMISKILFYYEDNPVIKYKMFDRSGKLLKEDLSTWFSKDKAKGVTLDPLNSFKDDVGETINIDLKKSNPVTILKTFIDNYKAFRLGACAEKEKLYINYDQFVRRVVYLLNYGNQPSKEDIKSGEAKTLKTDLIEKYVKDKKEIEDPAKLEGTALKEQALDIVQFLHFAYYINTTLSEIIKPDSKYKTGQEGGVDKYDANGKIIPRTVGEGLAEQTVGVVQENVDVGEQPVDVNQQPVDVNQQPVDVNQQPVDVNQQPVDVNQQPVGVTKENNPAFDIFAAAYANNIIDKNDSNNASATIEEAQRVVGAYEGADEEEETPTEQTEQTEPSTTAVAEGQGGGDLPKSDAQIEADMAQMESDQSLGDKYSKTTKAAKGTVAVAAVATPLLASAATGVGIGATAVTGAVATYGTASAFVVAQANVAWTVAFPALVATFGVVGTGGIGIAAIAAGYIAYRVIKWLCRHRRDFKEAVNKFVELLKNVHTSPDLLNQAYKALVRNHPTRLDKFIKKLMKADNIYRMNALRVKPTLEKNEDFYKIWEILTKGGNIKLEVGDEGTKLNDEQKKALDGAVAAAKATGKSQNAKLMELKSYYKANVGKTPGLKDVINKLKKENPDEIPKKLAEFLRTTSDAADEARFKQFIVYFRLRYGITEEGKGIFEDVDKHMLALTEARGLVRDLIDKQTLSPDIVNIMKMKYYLNFASYIFLDPQSSSEMIGMLENKNILKKMNAYYQYIDAVDFNESFKTWRPDGYITKFFTQLRINFKVKKIDPSVVAQLPNRKIDMDRMVNVYAKNHMALLPKSGNKKNELLFQLGDLVKHGDFVKQQMKLMEKYFSMTRCKEFTENGVMMDITDLMALNDPKIYQSLTVLYRDINQTYKNQSINNIYERLKGVTGKSQSEKLLKNFFNYEDTDKMKGAKVKQIDILKNFVATASQAILEIADAYKSAIQMDNSEIMRAKKNDSVKETAAANGVKVDAARGIAEEAAELLEEATLNNTSSDGIEERNKIIEEKLKSIDIHLVSIPNDPKEVRRARSDVVRNVMKLKQLIGQPADSFPPLPVLGAAAAAAAMTGVGAVPGAAAAAAAMTGVGAVPGAVPGAAMPDAINGLGAVPGLEAAMPGLLNAAPAMLNAAQGLGTQGVDAAAMKGLVAAAPSIAAAAPAMLNAAPDIAADMKNAEASNTVTAAASAVPAESAASTVPVATTEPAATTAASTVPVATTKPAVATNEATTEASTNTTVGGNMQGGGDAKTQAIYDEAVKLNTNAIGLLGFFDKTAAAKLKSSNPRMGLSGMPNAMNMNLLNRVKMLEDQVGKFKSQEEEKKLNEDQASIRAILNGEDSVAHKVKFLVDIPRWQKTKMFGTMNGSMEDAMIGLNMDLTRSGINELKNEKEQIVKQVESKYNELLQKYGGTATLVEAYDKLSGESTAGGGKQSSGGKQSGKQSSGSKQSSSKQSGGSGEFDQFKIEMKEFKEVVDKSVEKVEEINKKLNEPETSGAAAPSDVVAPAALPSAALPSAAVAPIVPAVVPAAVVPAAVVPTTTSAAPMPAPTTTSASSETVQTTTSAASSEQVTVKTVPTTTSDAVAPVPTTAALVDQAKKALDVARKVETSVKEDSVIDQAKITEKAEDDAEAVAATSNAVDDLVSNQIAAAKEIDAAKVLVDIQLAELAANMVADNERLDELVKILTDDLAEKNEAQQKMEERIKSINASLANLNSVNTTLKSEISNLTNEIEKEKKKEEKEKKQQKQLEKQQLLIDETEKIRKFELEKIKLEETINLKKEEYADKQKQLEMTNKQVLDLKKLDDKIAKKKATDEILEKKRLERKVEKEKAAQIAAEKIKDFIPEMQELVNAYKDAKYKEEKDDIKLSAEAIYESAKQVKHEADRNSRSADQNPIKQFLFTTERHDAGFYAAVYTDYKLIKGLYEGILKQHVAATLYNGARKTQCMIDAEQAEISASESLTEIINAETLHILEANIQDMYGQYEIIKNCFVNIGNEIIKSANIETVEKNTTSATEKYRNIKTIIDTHLVQGSKTLGIKSKYYNRLKYFRKQILDLESNTSQIADAMDIAVQVAEQMLLDNQNNPKKEAITRINTELEAYIEELNKGFYTPTYSTSSASNPNTGGVSNTGYMTGNSTPVQYAKLDFSKLSSTDSGVGFGVGASPTSNTVAKQAKVAKKNQTNVNRFAPPWGNNNPPLGKKNSKPAPPAVTPQPAVIRPDDSRENTIIDNPKYAESTYLIESDYQDLISKPEPAYADLPPNYIEVKYDDEVADVEDDQGGGAGNNEEDTANKNLETFKDFARKNKKDIDTIDTEYKIKPTIYMKSISAGYLIKLKYLLQYIDVYIINIKGSTLEWDKVKTTEIFNDANQMAKEILSITENISRKGEALYQLIKDPFFKSNVRANNETIQQIRKETLGGGEEQEGQEGGGLWDRLRNRWSQSIDLVANKTVGTAVKKTVWTLLNGVNKVISKIPGVKIIARPEGFATDASKQEAYEFIQKKKIDVEGYLNNAKKRKDDYNKKSGFKQTKAEAQAEDIRAAAITAKALEVAAAKELAELKKNETIAVATAKANADIARANADGAKVNADAEKLELQQYSPYQQQSLLGVPVAKSLLEEKVPGGGSKQKHTKHKKPKKGGNKKKTHKRNIKKGGAPTDNSLMEIKKDVDEVVETIASKNPITSTSGGGYKPRHSKKHKTKGRNKKSKRTTKKRIIK